MLKFHQHYLVSAKLAQGGEIMKASEYVGNGTYVASHVYIGDHGPVLVVIADEGADPTASQGGQRDG